MKRVFIICGLLLASISVFAQEANDTEFKTIFSKKGEKRPNGGYGAFSTGYSRMADRDALLMGGHGAWLIGGKFGIGISGTGFMTDKRYDSDLNDQYMYAGGYGGLRLEYILFPTSPVHVSIPVVIGGGGVAYTRSRYDYEFGYSPSSQAFFAFEPGVELELNLIDFMRVGFMVSYRFTSDIDEGFYLPGQNTIDSNILEGWSGTISFKFGKF